MIFILISLVLTILPLVVIAALLYHAYLNKKLPEELTEPESKAVSYPKAFLLACLLIAFGVNIFIYNLGGPGIGIGLFNLCIVLSFAILFPKHKRNSVFYMLSATALIAGFGIYLRSNGFIQGIDIAICVIIYGYFSLQTVFKKVYLQGTWLVTSLWFFALRLMRNVFVIFNNSKQGNRQQILRVLRNLGLTTILILFFSALLSSADPVFSQLVKEFMSQLGGRAVLTAIVLIALTFIFAIEVDLKEDKSIKLNFLPLNDLLIPSISLSILFSIFIFVQAKYLFGAHDYVQAYNLTYSEYARKGFTELLAVALFGGLVCYLLAVKAKEEAGNKSVLFLKIINLSLIIEQLFILFSAFTRDKIYVDTYGYTRIRVIGGLFLAWLGLFLAYLSAFDWVKKFTEEKFFKTLIGTTFVTVLLFNVLNMDLFIYTKNLPRTEYSDKDYYYVAMLSYDVAPAWTEIVKYDKDTYNSLYKKSILTDNEKKKLTDVKLSLHILKAKFKDLREVFASTQEATDQYYNCCDEYNSLHVVSLTSPTQDKDKQELPAHIRNRRNWLSKNRSMESAYKIYKENEELFESTVGCLITNINNYQMYWNIDLYTEEDFRLNTLTYPFVNKSYDYYPMSVDALRENYFRTYITPVNYNEIGYQDISNDIINATYPAPKECK